MEPILSPPEHSPEALLQCDDTPFGHAIVTMLENGSPPNDLELREKVKEIKIGMATLSASSHPLHRTAYNRMTSVFADFEGSAPDESLHTKYRITSDVAEWMKKSSYQDIIELCVWNTGRHQTLTNALRRNQAEIDERTMEMTWRSVDLGLFPKRAMHRIERVIDTFGAFRAIDSLKSAASGAVGYCEGDAMFVANLFLDRTTQTGVGDEIASAAFHERMHGLELQNAGFFSGITKRKLLRWLEEATVEHAAAVAVAGDPQPDSMLPSQRVDDKSFYQPERALLADIIAVDAADIPIDLLYEAFYSYGYATPRKEVESRLTAFFEHIGHGEPDYFYTFSEDYETATAAGVQLDVVQALSRAICDYRGMEIIDEQQYAS